MSSQLLPVRIQHHPKPALSCFWASLGSGPCSAPTKQLVTGGMCPNDGRVGSQQIIHLWIIKNVCHTPPTMSVLSRYTYIRTPSYPRWFQKQNGKPVWFGHVSTRPRIKGGNKLGATALPIACSISLELCRGYKNSVLKELVIKWITKKQP